MKRPARAHMNAIDRRSWAVSGTVALMSAWHRIRNKSWLLAIAAFLAVYAYLLVAATVLRSDQTTLRIPRQYVSNFSYPGLWFLSGGDDSRQSIGIRLSAEETRHLLPERARAPNGKARYLTGLVHLLSDQELQRQQTMRSAMVRDINEGTGEFSNFRITSVPQTGGIRVFPDNFNKTRYWFLVRKMPPGLQANDLIVRCYDHPVADKVNNCWLELNYDDIFVSITLDESDISRNQAISDFFSKLTESWRVKRH